MSMVRMSMAPMSMAPLSSFIALASPAEQLVLHRRDRALALAGVQRAVAIAIDQIVDRTAYRRDLDHAQLAGDAVFLQLVAALERARTHLRVGEPGGRVVHCARR